LSRGIVHCRHAAEGDATALEAECLGRFRDWFVMLATTRMTKSFKMVLLRVLLDNDAVFSGMPIPELAKAPYLDMDAGAGEPRVRLKDLFDRFPARALHAPARAGGIS
jgi:hypothetical protein